MLYHNSTSDLYCVHVYSFFVKSLRTFLNKTPGVSGLKFFERSIPYNRTPVVDTCEPQICFHFSWEQHRDQFIVYCYAIEHQQSFWNNLRWQVILWWYWNRNRAIKYLLISRNVMTFKSFNVNSMGSLYFILTMARIILFCWTTSYIKFVAYEHPNICLQCEKYENMKE